MEPTKILNADVFGPKMTLEEVEAAFSGNDHQMVRAVGKMCLANREECVTQATASAAVGEAANVSFNLGAASVLADMAVYMAGLMKGEVGDTVKGWFSE